MRVIIAGSRTISSIYEVRRAIYDSQFNITEVVSGGAPGVDRVGEDWARDHDIPVRLFRADWPKYGRRAGPLRNGRMAAYADALIAVTLGSLGTADMIRQAEAAGLLVFVRKVA